jgi:hypothetical protein
VDVLWIYGKNEGWVGGGLQFTVERQAAMRSQENRHAKYHAQQL